MRQHHPAEKINKEPVFGNVRIIEATSEDSQRKLNEAIEIREIRPAINKSKGWALTGVYTTSIRLSKLVLFHVITNPVSLLFIGS